jgi:hypothetical protein
MNTRGASLTGSLVVGCVAAAVGFWAGNAVDRTRAEERAVAKTAPGKVGKTTDSGNGYLLQSPGATATGRENIDYGLGDSAAAKLKPYPMPCKAATERRSICTAMLAAVPARGARRPSTCRGKNG